MNAVEFQTTIKNSFIQIPNYEAFENKPVRIIILDESTTQNTQKKTSNFIAKYSQNPITLNKHTTFLSRDEANER